MNIPLTVQSVQAAAVPHVTESIIDDNTRAEMGLIMGMPTERIDGEHISKFQRMSKPSNGHRSHKIQSSLSQSIAHKSKSNNTHSGRTSAATIAGVSTPAPVVGVSRKRVKKHLRKIAKTASPATQMAAEGTMEDLLFERPSTALAHILEKEEESESDPEDEEVTQSQQIAKDASHFKKLQLGRNGMN